MSKFFGALLDGFGECVVPSAGRLDDFATTANHADLAFDFIVDGPLDIAERVDVFDLDLGAEFLLAFGAY